MLKNIIKSSVILLLAILTGCSQSHKNLTLAYQDRIVDALSVIAVEKELISPQMDARMFSSGPQTIEALISGSAQIATMGDSAAIILLSKYDNFVIIAGLGTGPKRHRVIVSDNSGIHSWEDLAGKKIGIKKGTSTHGGFLLKSDQLGLNFEKEIIDMAPSLQLTALASGEIDVMVASEPSPSIAEGKGIGTHFAYLDIKDMTYPVVLVTTRETLEKRGNELKLLLKAYENAESFVTNNETEVVKIFSVLNGFNEDLVRSSMSLHQFHIIRPGEMIKTLEKLSSVLLDMGKISELPDWENAMDNTLFSDF